MIYLMRHGQTELNGRRVLQGRSDYPLNETGIRQAQEAAQALRRLGIRFDRVYASPLIRAVQTAEIVAPDVAPVLDRRLIEMDYGPYEGADLEHLPPEVLTFFKDFAHNPAPAGMEQLSAVTARSGAFLESIRGVGGSILLSTHAIAMKGALEYLTPGANGAYWAKYVGNCAVYAVENENGGFGVPYELELPTREKP